MTKREIIGKISLPANMNYASNIAYFSNTLRQTGSGNQSMNSNNTKSLLNNYKTQNNNACHQRAKSSNKCKYKASKVKKNLNIADVITQVPKNSQSNSYNSTQKLANTIKPSTHTLTNTNSFYHNLLYQQSKSISPTRTFISNPRYLLPKKESNKKTLVLDLDETLVHSCFIPFNCPSDLIIEIELENEKHDIHVLVRPHVPEFLEEMAKHYELVVFTASISKYANPLLNIIDKGACLPFRLYREHCTLINTTFVKDLTRLGRDLKDIIILDNSPLAYALNKDNGFPIPSWFSDKNDTELLKIIPILEFLSFVPDVRVFIKKIVKDNQIQFDQISGVINSYYNKIKNNSIPSTFRFEENKDGGITNIKFCKSNSIKGNLIKQIKIENLRNMNRKNRKQLNITGIETINRNKIGKCQYHNFKSFLNNLPTGNNNKDKDKENKENTSSIQSTEINKLSSLHINLDGLQKINTLKSNSSTKKIIYLVTKDKNEVQSELKTKLNNFLYNTNNGGTKGNNINHKKNTMSMSQRFGKKG